MEQMQDCESADVQTIGGRPTLRFGEFLGRLFAALREHQIEPCVLRNYEDFPESNVGNDLDLLICPHQLPSAIRALQSIAGVRIVGYNEQFHVAMTFVDGVSAVAGGRAFQVDFIRSFTWKGLPYLTPQEVLSSAIRCEQGGISFLVPSPMHEAIISLLTSLVISGFIKERYFAGVSSTVSNCPADAKALLQPAFGERASAQLVTAVIDGNRGKVLSCVGALRRALALRRSVRSPHDSLLQLIRHHAIVLGVRHRGRTLETIRVTGSDHKLISLAVDALIPTLRYLAPEVEHESDQSTDELPGQRISAAGLLTWLCRQWGKQFSGRKNLTLRISSTPLLNMSVNPGRCGYSGPHWIASLVMRLLPSADLWILLEPDSPHNETTIAKYRARVRSHERWVEVDAMATDGDEQTIERMREAIVRTLTQRTAERLR